jgi:hypothetical protein
MFNAVPSADRAPGSSAGSQNFHTRKLHILHCYTRRGSVGVTSSVYSCPSCLNGLAQGQCESVRAKSKTRKKGTIFAGSCFRSDPKWDIGDIATAAIIGQNRKMVG